MKPEAQILNRTQVQSQMSYHCPSSSGSLFIPSNWWSTKCGLFPVIHPALPYSDHVATLEEKQGVGGMLRFLLFSVSRTVLWDIKQFFLPVLSEMTQFTKVSNHIFASRLPTVSNLQSIQKCFNYWTYFKFLHSNPVTFIDFRGSENTWQAQGWILTLPYPGLFILCPCKGCQELEHEELSSFIPFNSQSCQTP